MHFYCVLFFTIFNKFAIGELNICITNFVLRVFHSCRECATKRGQNDSRDGMVHTIHSPSQGSAYTYINIFKQLTIIV